MRRRVTLRVLVLGSVFFWVLTAKGWAMVPMNQNTPVETAVEDGTSGDTALQEMAPVAAAMNPQGSGSSEGFTGLTGTINPVSDIVTDTTADTPPRQAGPPVIPPPTEEQASSPETDQEGSGGSEEEETPAEGSEEGEEEGSGEGSGSGGESESGEGGATVYFEGIIEIVPNEPPPPTPEEILAGIPEVGPPANPVPGQVLSWIQNLWNQLKIQYLGITGAPSPVGTGPGSMGGPAPAPPPEPEPPPE